MSSQYVASLYNSGYKHPLIDMDKHDLSVSRIDLLDHLISVIPNCERYLEIGDGAANFSVMKPKFKTATMMDIYAPTSCDLVFINAHESKDTIRDITNCLKHISPEGMIVVHNCKPRKESEALIPRPVPHTLWNGDVWKAVLWARCQPNLDCAVLNADWGLMVIKQRNNTSPILFETLEEFHSCSLEELIDKVKWDDYVKYQNKWLRPLSFESLKLWLVDGKLKEDLPLFEKVDSGAPVRLLVVSPDKELLKKIIQLPYGSIWFYSECDIQKAIAKHSINVVWSSSPSLPECYWVCFSPLPPDLLPKDLVNLAEKQYFEHTMKPTFDIFGEAYAGEFVPAKLTNPLISLFSSTYRSKGRVKRTFQSLRNQTYKNWEWIVIFDSDIHSKIDLADVELFDEFCKLDGRVKVYFSHRHSGNIGEMKFNAVGMCRGDIILELDHDDELTPNCLELTAKAFEMPICPIFVYSFCSEPEEINVKQYSLYYLPYAKGYGSYRKEKYQEIDWITTCTGYTTNAHSVSHIVGVPNHLRAWRRDFYYFIGGHSRLWVGDDYELIIRTYLAAPKRIVSIPLMLYVQYRNLTDQAKNNTFSRNAAIQRLVVHVYCHYADELNKRIPIPDRSKTVIPAAPILFPWTVDPKDFVHGEILYREDKMAYLFVCGADKETCLKLITEKAVDKPHEILIAGINNSWLDDATMTSLDIKESIVRWWNYRIMEIARTEADWNPTDPKHALAVKSQAMWSLVGVSNKIKIFYPEAGKEEEFTFE